MREIAVAALGVCMLVGGSSAFAQEASPQSSAGLYGRKLEEKTAHALDVSGTVVEAYDDDVYADGGAPINPGQQQAAGYYSMFQANSNDDWKGKRSHVGATGGATMRYYQEDQTVQWTNFTGGLGFSSQLSTRTSVFANQTASYSPSYFYRLFPTADVPTPGAVAPPAPDYTVPGASSASYSYSTTATLSHSFGPRAALSGQADYGYTDFVENSVALRDSKTYGVRGDYSRNMSRNTVARFGYRYRNGDVGFGAATGRPTVEHGLDVGVDYSRPLSATRRATFAFSVGSSAVSLPDSTLGELRGQVYRAIGSAKFGYQFSRAWQATTSYRRGLDYVPGLSQPVFTDGLSAVVNGLFNQRWDFTAQAGYSSGEPAYFTQTATYKTYTGDVRLRYALTRLWAIQAEYLYYFYDFNGALVVPQDSPPQLERNGVRVGVTWWIPALRR